MKFRGYQFSGWLGLLPSFSYLNLQCNNEEFCQMKKDESPNLAKLQADLEAALSEHTDALSEENRASSRECNARNRVNAAQKAIDAAMDKMRERADRGTNWGQQRRNCVSTAA